MTTLTTLIDSYVDSRLAKGEIGEDTARQFRVRLGTLVNAVGDADHLDRGHIDTWQRHIGHHSVATRNTYLSTMRTFCRWLVAEEMLDADPTIRSRSFKAPRRVPRALPAAAVGKVLRVASDARSAAIVRLMVGLGLRRCEVARLEVGDWDRASQTVLVTGKGGHERVLPVPAPVADALGAYLDQVGATAGPLIRDKGQAVSPDWVSAQMTGLLRQAGVKRSGWDGVTPHALRHTAASDVLDHCHDVRIVQEMLGHASIATTQIYLRRANLDQLRAAMSGRDYRAA